MTLLFLSTPALAATIVSAAGTGLEQAIESASDGDTLLVQDGTWAAVSVDKDLVIQAAGPQVHFESIQVVDGAEVQVSGGSMGHASVDSAMLSVQSVVFRSGATPSYAMEVRDGTLRVEAVDLRAWAATGLYAEHASVSIEASVFADIQGDESGAIHAVDSDLSIRASSFVENSARGFGGSIYAQGGSLDVQDSSFEGGDAERGGHVMVSGGEASFTRVSSSDAYAGRIGGAFYSVESTVSYREVSVDTAWAEHGGAFAARGGSVEARDLSVVGGHADSGGAFWIEGAVVDMTRTRFVGGVARQGGAVAMQRGQLSARNGFWTHTEWADVGGGFYMDGGDAELSYMLIAANQGEVGAGVAVQSGSLELDGCLVWGNQSEGIANAGGAVVFAHSLSSENPGGDAVGPVQGWERRGSLDPRFVSPSQGDWALSSWSPAIDAGPSGQADRDGTPADMGPYGGPDAWRLADVDGDGWVYGRDCDDLEPSVHPYAKDYWYDGVDSDCMGNDDFDADGDGVGALEDCNDADPDIYPGAVEGTGDSVDSDCDGVFDADLDGDGWTANFDCDDGDPDVHPLAEDPWYDGIDSDCVGNDDYDADGDGYPVKVDCDDGDALIAPGRSEIADDGIDQDCDGADARTPEPGDHTPLQSAELPPPPGLSAEVRTGCSSTGAPSTFLAAFLAFIGLLLHRR